MPALLPAPWLPGSQDFAGPALDGQKILDAGSPLLKIGVLAHPAPYAAAEHTNRDTPWDGPRQQDAALNVAKG
ncbi:hypothetical protein ACINB_35500 [Acidovorax sp. NB1]|nr:hypothetical protein ACINB_35500 [Acidovorax sp. NB1]